ncbi:MAG: SecD/SecF fusion protein [Planctomycetota bacterium]|jgi:SecD/SecF fusion protein
MLENARRQFLLVLVALIAGAACWVLLPPTLGPDLKGGTQLLYNIPQDVLKRIIQKEGATAAEIMAQTITVMRERIDPNGTLDPLITQSGDSGILIELGEFDNPNELKRVLERIGNLGRLEMRMVAYEDYLVDGTKLFTLATERPRLEAWLKIPANKELIDKDPKNIRRFNESVQSGPLARGNLHWYPREVRANPKDNTRWDDSFTTYPKLQSQTVRAFDDAQYTGGVISEAVKSLHVKDQRLIEFVAINMKERSFTGEDLDPSGVGAGYGGNGLPGVNYRMRGGLTAEYADWSSEHKGKSSAIILNGYVKSAPAFVSKITRNGIITGSFTQAEVDELVKVLRTGSLRIEPELLSQVTIGAQLGDQAINRGLFSILGGGVLVFLFMLAFYKLAGTIACVSLLLNVFLLYAGMLFMQATITLPGLGGIVLTLGMAVDANVLIYERIREELNKGKELLQAVRAGFERAMSAILDSNITTFLVGLVLFNVGVGPVRGFAVTLMVGIVTTVFTQFFVSRLLFHWALTNKKLEGWKPNTLFENRSLDFVGKIKACVALSAIVIVAGLSYSMSVPSEKLLSIDFTGGANLRMVCSQDLTADFVRDALKNDKEFIAEYPTTGVNTYGETGNQFNVRLKLNATQRDQINEGRKVWRELRKTAPEGTTTAVYEPPYLDALRRIFGGKLVDGKLVDNKLVDQAFSGGMLTESARNGDSLQNAQLNVHFTDPVDLKRLQDLLGTGLSESLIVPLPDLAATSSKNFRIEWTTQITTKKWQLAEIVSEQIATLEDDNKNPIVLSDPFPEAQEIQGRLVNDLRNAAIGALILAWVLIVFYLRVRFHEYKYGLAAVVALVHDVLVTFVIVVMFNNMGLVNAEIGLAMIACFLTIIGYSVNDTIVVFDRIRENRIENARNNVDESFRSLINRSLNQTLSRTILTTVLTLFVVIAQLVVNYNSGSDLEAFAFAMTVGMISGVYSTMYIAAPILIWMDKGGPVEVPDGPRDASIEGDFDNEADILAKEEAAAAAAAAEKS